MNITDTIQRLYDLQPQRDHQFAHKNLAAHRRDDEQRHAQQGVERRVEYAKRLTVQPLPARQRVQQDEADQQIHPQRVEPLPRKGERGVEEGRSQSEERQRCREHGGITGALT